MPASSDMQTDLHITQKNVCSMQLDDWNQLFIAFMQVQNYMTNKFNDNFVLAAVSNEAGELFIAELHKVKNKQLVSV